MPNAAPCLQPSLPLHQTSLLTNACCPSTFSAPRKRFFSTMFSDGIISPGARELAICGTEFEVVLSVTKRRTFQDIKRQQAAKGFSCPFISRETWRSAVFTSHPHCCPRSDEGFLPQSQLLWGLRWDSWTGRGTHTCHGHAWVLCADNKRTSHSSEACAHVHSDAPCMWHHERPRSLSFYQTKHERA